MVSNILDNQICLHIFLMFYFFKLFGFFPNIHIKNGCSFVYNFSRFWLIYSLLLQISLIAYANIAPYMLNATYILYSKFSSSISYGTRQMFLLQNMLCQISILYNNKNIANILNLYIHIHNKINIHNNGKKLEIGRVLFQLFHSIIIPWMLTIIAFIYNQNSNIKDKVFSFSGYILVINISFLLAFHFINFARILIKCFVEINSELKKVQLSIQNESMESDRTEFIADVVLKIRSAAFNHENLSVSVQKVNDTYSFSFLMIVCFYFILITFLFYMLILHLFNIE
ncbi:hypothetical protein L9F63_010388, partial [Diploptera punctata]